MLLNVPPNIYCIVMSLGILNFVTLKLTLMMITNYFVAQNISRNLCVILHDDVVVVDVVVAVDNIMQHISTVFKQSYSTLTEVSTRNGTNT